MISNLRELIPGVELWPHFVRKESERFEGWLSLVEVTKSQSLLLRDIISSRLPIARFFSRQRAGGARHCAFSCDRACRIDVFTLSRQLCQKVTEISR